MIKITIEIVNYFQDTKIVKIITTGNNLLVCMCS